jgi:hypothetical protein
LILSLNNTQKNNRCILFWNIDALNTLGVKLDNWSKIMEVAVESIARVSTAHSMKGEPGSFRVEPS